MAGCSVGSSVINSVIMDLRPKNIKIADKSVYKMENINRVRLSYYEMVRSQSQRSSVVDMSLKNKAKVVADQLYSIDPFLNVRLPLAHRLYQACVPQKQRKKGFF